MDNNRIVEELDVPDYISKIQECTDPNDILHFNCYLIKEKKALRQTISKLKLAKGNIPKIIVFLWKKNLSNATINSFYEFIYTYKNNLDPDSEIEESFIDAIFLGEMPDNLKEFSISGDYIGPTIANCHKLKGLSAKQKLQIQAIGRTLGGHMVWPKERSKNVGQSINTQRSKILNDRIDITLYFVGKFCDKLDEGKCKGLNEDDVREIINDIPKKLFTKTVSNNVEGFLTILSENYKFFLVEEKEGDSTTFKNFIDTFKLNAFVCEVNGEYQVYDLGSTCDNVQRFDDENHEFQESYENFIVNNLKCIIKRNYEIADQQIPEDMKSILSLDNDVNK